MGRGQGQDRVAGGGIMVLPRIGWLGRSKVRTEPGTVYVAGARSPHRSIHGRTVGLRIGMHGSGQHGRGERAMHGSGQHGRGETTQVVLRQEACSKSEAERLAQPLG